MIVRAFIIVSVLGLMVELTITIQVDLGFVVP